MLARQQHHAIREKCDVHPRPRHTRFDRVLRNARYDGSFEDLFFFIEHTLASTCGAQIAGKMHTARSRNDIDLTMYRMVLRESHDTGMLDGLIGSARHPSQSRMAVP